MENEKTNKSFFIKITSLIEKIWTKFFTREVITYLIAGVLTTIINLRIFYVAADIMGIDELISNAIAWVIAVAFAYFINALWVFKSKYISVTDEIEKVIRFVSGRIASFLVEEAGIFIFVKCLEIDKMLIKVALAVVVIIMNYVVSKLFVFKK